MSKFLKLCKFPFLIISFVLFSAFCVMLICLSYSVNSSKNYSFQESYLGAEISVDLSLFDNGEAYLSYHDESYLYEKTDTSVWKKYRILNHNLYIYRTNEEGEETDAVLFGKIDAFQITPNQMALQTFNIYFPNIVLTNNLTTTLKMVSIIGLSVFGFFTIQCFMILILYKKGQLKED